MLGVILLVVFLLLVVCFCLTQRRDPNEFIVADRVIPNSGRQGQPMPQRYLGFQYQRPGLQQRDPGQRLPNQFHSFIVQRVIPTFHHQRQRGDQFAVLLLIPESNRHDINCVNLQPQDINQQPLVNSADYYSPNRQRYRNYVAARPHVVHSEITLLEELRRLWEAFVYNYHFIPSYVILYSWMMPCSDCTEKICQTLQNARYNNTLVIVAYTTDWTEIPRAENNENRDKLQAAGIKVEQVAYDSYLPPVQDI